MANSELPSDTDAIVLVGAGRNANNLIGLLEGLGKTIAAVLDDGPVQEVLGYKVVQIEQYAGPVWAALMTITDPDARRSVSTRSSLRRCTWTSFIDPRAVVSPRAVIGQGVFLAPFTACADVVIGNHVSVMASVVVGARVHIGDFSSVLPNATIGSDAQIGFGCLVGMGARVAAGVRIGNDCRIAPNCVVRRDMPDCSIAAIGGVGTRIFRRSTMYR